MPSSSSAPTRRQRVIRVLLTDRELAEARRLAAEAERKPAEFARLLVTGRLPERQRIGGE